MRARRQFCALLVTVLILAGTAVFAARIDATKGRQYPITKQHGPWMIMVASLSEPPQDRRKEGISPEEAAEELVYALRKKGIPAYSYRLGERQEEIQTTDRTGRSAKAHFRAQKASICVLAGNYPTINDKVGQDTLSYLKKIRLEDLHLKSWEENGVFRSTPGQPGPFSGAFLSMNPLLSPEEVAQKKRDPLLLKLNGSGEYSILENKGRYTLVVATFKGRAETQVGESGYQKALSTFKITDSLDDAAEKAWKVTRMLRDGMIDGTQKGRKFDAFVYHDHHQSLVTIGSFDSPQDPRIAALAQLFGAKTQKGSNGQSYTVGEGFLLPGNPPEPFVFDPRPRLIEVPQLR